MVGDTSKGKLEKILKECFEDDFNSNIVTSGADKINIYCLPAISDNNNKSGGVDPYFTLSKDRYESMLSYMKSGKVFFLTTHKDFADYIFSFEAVGEYSRPHVNINPFYGIDRTLDIVRMDNTKQSFPHYLVAIKIGPEGQRDYTALKHYFESSDNRTYNNVVRNMIRYIEVEGKRPESISNKVAEPHNLLVSGAPGTGKSTYLDRLVEASGKTFADAAANADGTNGISADVKRLTAMDEYKRTFMQRVTFYENYSYESFVGCYKPVPVRESSDIIWDDKNGKITEKRITYLYTAGPLIDMYVKALNDPKHNYFLIIEEINRARAAAVFGDIFQLLDRKNGVSEYFITPDAALGEYLGEHLNSYDGTMRLPANLYIWATMNSADQGVFPLDSAFKRRWSSLYMDLNVPLGGANVAKLRVVNKNREQKYILWENLRNLINEVILASGFDEDRCVGSWFLRGEEIDLINEFMKSSDVSGLVNPMADKLMYYLRQDVFRLNPSKMFRTDLVKNVSMSYINATLAEKAPLEKLLNISIPDDVLEDIPADDNKSGNGTEQQVSVGTPVTSAAGN